MTEFNFLGSWQDTLTILQQILDLKTIRVLADVAYREPLPFEVNSLSASTQNTLKKNYRVFLETNTCSLYPIKFSKPNNNGYVGIQQLESGPLMGFSLPHTYKDNGKLIVGGGHIEYPPNFLIPYTNTSYKPPQELRKVYQQIKIMIQKNMVKRYWCWTRKIFGGEIISSKEILWLGKDAFELIYNNGYVLQWGMSTINPTELFEG
jgi:hypothetical protein